MSFDSQNEDIISRFVVYFVEQFKTEESKNKHKIDSSRFLQAFDNENDVYINIKQ